MKLSLVEKNILKTTGYQRYCTARRKRIQDHVTDHMRLGADTTYPIIKVHLESSKYLKCFCSNPSAFYLKETKHPSV